MAPDGTESGELVRTAAVGIFRFVPDFIAKVEWVRNAHNARLETADANQLTRRPGPKVIVWKGVREQQRKELLNAKLLGVYGTWQREGEVRNLIAKHFVDLTHLLGRLAPPSRDFH